MLDVTHLCGFMSGNSPPASVTYIGGANIETNLSTYTFSAQDIGAAAPDRFVIVGVQGTTNSGDSTINSVTIGGNAATLLGGTLTNGGGDAVAFYGLSVPTGTTADIVVVFANTRGNAGVVVYRAVGLLSTTPYDAQTHAPSGSQTVTTVSINKPQDGFIIGLSTHYTTGAATATWVGATEDFDGSPMESTNGNQSGASENVTAGASSQTVSCTWSTATTNTNALVVIAMR